MESIKDIIYQHLSAYLDDSFADDYKKKAKQFAERNPETNQKYYNNDYYQYKIDHMPSVGHERRDGYDYFWYSAMNDFEDIKTVSFHGTLQDIRACLYSTAIEDEFGGRYSEKDYPRADEFTIDERPVSDFHSLFCTVLECVSGGSWLSKEAADKMAQHLSKEGVRMFFPSFHYGYLGGGLFAFLRESTEEIAILILAGSD